MKQSSSQYRVRKRKVMQKATRKTMRERKREIPISILPNINARSSVRLKLMFKAKMMATTFEMAIVISKTMTISQTIRKKKEKIKISLISLRY